MTRKEKFSEIERRVNAALEPPICHYSVTVLANYILAELEAAGKQWDPEEPEGLRLVAYGGALGYLVGRADSALTEPMTEAQAREVIRRHEALPRIEEAFRRWQAAEYGDRSEDDLFAGVVRRLLGKEGS